jgi:hypothetical protein
MIQSFEHRYPVDNRLRLGATLECSDFKAPELLKGIRVQACVVKTLRQRRVAVILQEPLKLRHDGRGVPTTETEEIADTIFAAPLSQRVFEGEPKSHERRQPIEMEVLDVEMDVDGSPVRLRDDGAVVCELCPKLCDSFRDFREKNRFAEDILGVILTAKRPVVDIVPEFHSRHRDRLVRAFTPLGNRTLIGFDFDFETDLALRRLVTHDDCDIKSRLCGGLSPSEYFVHLLT